MFDAINKIVKTSRFAGGGTSSSCQKLKNFEHANACKGLQKLARTTEIPQKNLSGAKPRKTERSRSENRFFDTKKPKLDNIVSGYPRPQISKIHNDIIKEIPRLEYLCYQYDSREKESIDVPIVSRTNGLSRSIPYTITKTGASIVYVDQKNKNYKLRKLKQKRKSFVVKKILEHNDWITSTPILYYRGEAVSVFNLLNNVTTLNPSSRIGAFAANEDILLNKSMKFKNNEISRELYAITPHRQFCRWGSFSASFQLIQ